LSPRRRRRRRLLCSSSLGQPLPRRRCARCRVSLEARCHSGSALRARRAQAVAVPAVCAGMLLLLLVVVVVVAVLLAMVAV
jgi:hypothetical protein